MTNLSRRVACGVLAIILSGTLLAQGRDVGTIMNEIDPAFDAFKKAATRDEQLADVIRYATQLESLLAEARDRYAQQKNTGAVAITDNALSAIAKTIAAAKAGDMRTAKFSGSELNDACVSCHKTYRDYGQTVLLRSSGSSSPSVFAVSRARVWGAGPTAVTPSSVANVVLAIAVRGVSDEQWRGDVYVSTAGTDRINIAKRVRWEGSNDKGAVFVVPSTALRFSLHVSGQPALVFEAPVAVKDRLMGHP